MGLYEKTKQSRMEVNGPSLEFLRGLIGLAETQGESVLAELYLAMPRKMYDAMIKAGSFQPRPRSGQDRRQGDRRRGDRRG